MPKVINFNNKLDNINSIITLGNFDGVHLGHKQLINNLIDKRLEKTGLSSILITFNPHTQFVINRNKKFKLIDSYESKIKQLKKYNIDYISIIDFDKSFSKLSAKDFIDTIVRKYNPSSIIIGYDSKFGYKGEGDYTFLKKYLSRHDIDVLQNKSYSYNGEIIKSSFIKRLIEKGDIESVNKYLDREFTLSGVVVKGDKIGKSLGFPTANLDLKNKEQIIPKVGVYYVTLVVDNVEYKALCNIGYRPTFFENGDLVIESYIVEHGDFNLYDKKIDIKFNSYIRDEKTFNNKEDLVKQIKKDIKIIA